MESTCDTLKSMVATGMQQRRDTVKYESLLTAVDGDIVLSEQLRRKALEMDQIISWLDPSLASGVSSVSPITTR